MRRLGKWLGRVFLALGVAAGGLFLFGPREPVDLAQRFNARETQIAGDPDRYLAARESVFDDIVPGLEKRIVWAGEPGEKTAISVVYLHGFSASSEEIRPVPDRVAAGLGANLYFARLAGHGRGGAAMAGPSVADWAVDLDEALAIGEAIGGRVLIIATSTGATLASVAAQDPERARPLAGLVLISPNFRIANPAAVLLTWPAARAWVPLITGPERAFTPANAAQAAYWSERYPVAALFPMAAMVRAVRGLDFAKVTTPTLFIYSPDDQVVDASETARLLAGWGGGPEAISVAPGVGVDAAAHVIAGDIMSPANTGATVDQILAWAARAGVTGQ